MTELTTAIASSLLILATLVFASVVLNRYIERRPLARRVDGETALWVAIGCAYTVFAAAVLLALWAPWLGVSWHLGFWALLCMLAAFTAAGIPMFVGELRRTQAWRETNEHLARR